MMKYLLTSAGMTNPSIHAALVSLLSKPIAESNALCIPTASYANRGGFGQAWAFSSGNEPQTPMCELGWKSLGILELTALPSLGRAHWLPQVQACDVLLVGGGDPLYLHYWMQQSGLAELLPTLSETLYVGLSAGSMVLTPAIGQFFVNWTPPHGGDDKTLGLVNFSIFPHLEHPALPHNTLANAQTWAASLNGPSYAIDDQTAIKVVGSAVEVVSEGQWQQFG